MKINKPMLFNGDLLASKREILEWLGLTINATQTGIENGSIKADLISGDSLTNITAADIKVADGTTVASELTRLSDAIAAAKTYEVTAVASGAITVTPTITDAKDSFAVGLALDGTSLTQSTAGLKLTDDYIQLVKGTDADAETAGYAAIYDFIVGGTTKTTINIPKDQFLKTASYVPSAEVLRFEFNLANGDSNIVDIPVGTLVDEYSAGNGIEITDQVDGKNIVAVKLAEETVTAGTLTVDAAGVHFVDNLGYTKLEAGLPASALTEAVTKDTIYVDATSGIVAVAAAGTTEVTEIINGKAITDYVDTISAYFDTNLTTNDGKYSAIVELTDTLGTTVETAPAVNTLYVDPAGQTGIVLAGSIDVIDISQEFVSDASAIISGETALVTAGAVADYVTEKETALIDEINTKVTKVTDAVEGNITTFAASGEIADSGKKFVTELVSGSIDIATAGAVKDYVDAAIADVNSELDALDINKFQLVTDFETAPEGETEFVNDRLYFTAEGQAKIFDGNTWHSLSMEASTDLVTDAPSGKVATAEAIKTYVDTADKAIKDKAVEMLETEVTVGGETTGTVSGRVVAVYDADNEQCYPTIKYAAGISTISVDDITETVTLTVLYAKRINANDGSVLA